MADSGAWDQGWALGSGIAQQKIAHKQALSDEEFQQKAQDLIDARKGLQEKYSATLDANGLPTTSSGEFSSQLQDNAKELRELYHPDKNPGALSKFGNMLTDALHVTNPQKREAKRETKAAAAANSDKAAAQQAIAGAPLSPTQVATQKQQLENAAYESTINSRVALFDKLFPNASPEDRQRYVETITGALSLGATGAPTAFIDTDGQEFTAQRGKDGRWYSLDNSPIPDERMLGAKVAPKPVHPSTSALNEGLAAYASSHGFKAYDDIPPEYRDAVFNYEQQKQKLDQLYGTATTSTNHFTDANNQVRFVTVSNYKTPGGAIIPLADPMPWAKLPTASSQLPQGVGRNAQVSPPTKGTHPHAPASANTPPSSGSAAWKNLGSGMKMSPPVAVVKNKELDDAHAALNAAIHRDNLMHKNLQDALANKEDQQAMLSLVANHIGMTLGAQKGARINQAVWNEAVTSAPWLITAVARWGTDGYLAGVVLTPEQMKQMVKLADESLDVTKQDLATITARQNQGLGGNNPQQGNADIDSIVNGLQKLGPK